MDTTLIQATADRFARIRRMTAELASWRAIADNPTADPQERARAVANADALTRARAELMPRSSIDTN
jgi:hypothetical protein